MEKALLRLDLREEHSGRAKHERLKDHLVGEMLAGRLKPGQALPSEQHLVQTLGVARMTIRQAMGSLENDGLIRRVRGKGTFVDEDARRKLHRGQDIFALVVPETRTSFFPSLLHSFEATATEVRHHTIVCNTAGELGLQGDMVLQLIDREVGGVAIHPTNLAPTPVYQIRQLHKHGIPVVFLHRRVEGVTAPLLAMPYDEIGALAGRTLVERGHRQVAMYTVRRSAAGVSAFEKGLREALQAGGSDLRDELCHFDEVRPDQSASVSHADRVLNELRRMFALPDPPTAIFATCDSLAETIYLLLQQMGLRVPEDVSLIGCGPAFREGALAQRIASVVVDEVATGRQAVSLLHEMRIGKRPIDDDTEIVLRPGLSEGQTVATVASKVQGVA